MKTHELLKMTQEAYELLIFDWWLSFCLHKAPSEKQVQKLLVNNTLFQWWRAQLAAAEEVFVEEAQPYYNTYSPKDAKKLYAKTVYRIQLYYNHDLLKNALKQ
mgnify:CR=1 FL=1